MKRSLIRSGGIVLAILPLACTQPSRKHAIVIEQFKFMPDTIAVRPGDTLVFTNHDIVPHTATARDSSWDSGSIAPQSTRQVVVERTGDYYCAFHPTMLARVVTEAE